MDTKIKWHRAIGIFPVVMRMLINNALFMKDPQTVVAFTARIFGDGHGEVYWKEGQINF